MFTKARYFSTLLTNPLPNLNTKNMLVFDNIGKINFSALNSFVSTPIPILSEKNETVLINSDEIVIAAILYAISQREGQEVGIGDFNGETIISALIKHMNPAIENKYEVAGEIYQSWQILSNKLNLIQEIQSCCYPY